MVQVTKKAFLVLMAISGIMMILTGATYVVDKSGGGDSTTISGAMALAIGAGDSVLVLPGLYSGEGLSYASWGNDGIVLRGTDRSTVIIKDDLSAQIIQAPLSNRTRCRIENLTLRGDLGDTPEGIRFLADSDSFTVFNVTIDSTKMPISAFQVSGSAVMQGNTIDGLIVTNPGPARAGLAGIEVNSETNGWVIKNSEFDFSTATSSGGVAVRLAGVKNLEFSNNYVASYASGNHAILVAVDQGDTVQSTGITITGNRILAAATTGVAVMIGSGIPVEGGPDEIEVSYNIIDFDTPITGSGYAIETESTTTGAFSSNNRIVGNVINNGNVGVLFAEGAVWNVAMGNSITVSSKGLYLQDSRHNTMTNNTVIGAVSGVYYDNGGQLYHNFGNQVVGNRFINVGTIINQDTAGWAANDSSTIFRGNIAIGNTNWAMQNGVAKTLAEFQTDSPSDTSWMFGLGSYELNTGGIGDPFYKISGAVPWIGQSLGGVSGLAPGL